MHTLTVKRLKEELEDIDETLPVVICSGNAFYAIMDIDHTRKALEIYSGEHYDFNKLNEDEDDE